MKKVLLTAAIAFSTLFASAQFMVVTTYDGDQEETMDKITQNMGVGYMVNDAFTVGAAQGGADAVTGEDTYDLWVRYNIAQVEGSYASLTMPGDEAEEMMIGVGFAFNVWNGLYVEPNYTMPTSEDADGNREGSFNFGLSYRF